ncbi:MAG: GNAT family N-acetyltransferase [Candidatus Lokiarchaeota archaeon]|nr:GNAT family N-acetyltransferase [Candidatus Lokiarchaeota archaeon]MBD3200877.1 GNAT family N-acetyltransferase [Candidatus Lokiarchaeota archaeon]
MVKKEKIGKFIEGEQISLIPSYKDHMKLYAKWMNDPNVRIFSRNMVPISLNEIKKWFEPSEVRFKDFIAFEIFHTDDKKPIGTAGLNKINWYARHANMFAMIGETQYWGNNIATEVARLLLDYGFKELNLNKIYANIAVPNIGSWKVAEKIGFVYNGISKNEFYVNGEYIDAKKYHLLKDDWLSKKE